MEFLILLMGQRVLRVRFFQQLDSLVLFFDLLAEFVDQVFQFVELLVVNGGRCRNRQRHDQREGGGAS